MNHTTASKEIQEAKLAGAEAILRALIESLAEGHSFGRVVERWRELSGVSGIAEWEMLQTAGGLTINNTLFDVWEKEFLSKMEARKS